MTTSDLLDGARNCVIDCAQIGQGSTVAVVNEAGTDPGVVTAIAEIARDAGARVQVVWAEPYPKDDPQAKIPENVFAAFRDADILVNHYHSLSRVAVQDQFPAEARIRVPNRATSSALLSSAWARFPYGMQKALSDSLEDVMAPGRRWRITSPAGTDLRGQFVEADSALAQAYFQTDEDNNRARRNFPGGVHTPRISTGINGILVAEYVDGAPADMPPVRMKIVDGKVVDVEGGDPEGRARARILESDGHVDSWHSGVNPKTVVPVTRASNPRKWYSYAHCSPKMVHFHLGRTHSTINVACLDQTLEIEHRAVYENGALVDFSDRRIKEALAHYKLDTDVLRTEPILV
jgi:leucyl aminopeptidase (aminopeptidase T)